MPRYENREMVLRNATIVLSGGIMKKSKSKGGRPRSNPSPTAIAELAGCSHAVACRLLKRGMSPEAIVQRFAERSERRTNEPGARLPVRPVVKPGVNGGGAGGGPEPFHVAQSRKESTLADLRAHELAMRRGLVAPTRELNAWFATQVIRIREVLGGVAGILCDRLAVESNPAKCGALVDAEIRRALAGLKLFGERYAETLKGSGEKTERLRDLVRQIVALLDEE
jgi:hypothetical protein